MQLNLTNRLAPGDVVVSSALIRDIKQQYGDAVQLTYSGSSADYFANCPHLQPAGSFPDAKNVKLRYDGNLGIHNSNANPRHFISSYIECFNADTGLNVKLTKLAPEHYLTAAELRPAVPGAYWVVVAGGKVDFTAKWWPDSYWQTLIRSMPDIKFVQVGRKEDRHPALLMDNVLDMRGSTTLRELTSLIANSQGVVCPVTCAMHLAAACARPCVVLAGGREPWWWEAYNDITSDINMRHFHGAGVVSSSVAPHTYLHTGGMLPCCTDKYCWKSRAHFAAPGDKKRCAATERDGSTYFAACMHKITPSVVVDAVRQIIERPTMGTAVLEHTEPAAEAVSSSSPAPARTTICILLFGDYFEHHKRCLSSVLKTTDRATVDIRIGLNAVPLASTRELVAELQPDMLIDSNDNIKKYPMMRKLFADLQTDTVVWFDDDSYCTHNLWLPSVLADLHHKQGHHGELHTNGIAGQLYRWKLQPGQADWIRAADWYAGRPIQDSLIFPTGGFWCASTAAIKQLNWPDSRILHNGGDTMLAAALYQAGYNCVNSHNGVQVNRGDRRGYSEVPAGVRR